MRGIGRRGWVALLAIAPFVSDSANAQHACDDLGDRGWGTVPTVETVARVDSKPYRAEADGNWYVDRKTTLLPFCNYYNSIGNYSLRSYSLTPEDKIERVEICHSASPGAPSSAVAPYAGSCPPQPAQ